MQDAVQLSLTVGSDVAAKLSELAGGEVNSGEYLTLFVRLLHAERQVSDEETDMAEMISSTTDFVARCKAHVKTIRTLRQRLASISREQEVLLATVELLTEALDSKHPALSAQRLH
jgi:hypothetical protein